MTEVSKALPIAINFPELLASKEYDDELGWSYAVLGDFGVGFPEGAADLIDSLDYADEEDLVYEVERFAGDLQYAGKTLMKAIKKYCKLRTLELALTDAAPSVEV